MSVSDGSTRTASAAIQEMPRPPWRGVNHLALITPDMDATVRFYHGILGMRLVATVMAGPMRHYFFEIAPGNTVAFFEWQGSDTFRKPAGWRVEQALQLDHLSFNIPDHQALLDLQARLQEAGVEVTEEVDHGFIHSIYFTDPNGIALEASFWLADATARPEDDRGAFMDPDPVAAVRELLEAGRLEWLPATDLVPEPSGIS
ncbi:MAG TPA: VOC family protein [Candidatus Dormibacteraeota bacterium]|jgi:catechol 2,3-dioxygenase-like lactoylglutathione lyase family enzyme|nr:VOC family protein [Candidatus Dormibacteraeota bacterium]